MVLLIDCRQLDLKNARGLENFGIAIIQGLVGEVESIVLDVPSSSYTGYRHLFGAHPNVSIIRDPLQAIFQRLGSLRIVGRAFRWLFYRLKLLTGYDATARRAAWATRAKADVVYYPSHRDTHQHRHIPSVCTIHAILPEYTRKEMAILESQIHVSEAIITSWPYPYKDLLHRYPELNEKLYLVPYTAKGIFELDSEDDVTQLELPEEFYFYPSGVFRRKNHLNLIRAASILCKRGERLPAIVCTGGGDALLEAEVSRLAVNLGVADRVLFVGHLEPKAMAITYRRCKAALSCSLWEAGIAPLQEAAQHGKPTICSDIPPARAHADMLGLDVCFFDPEDPEDIANKLVEFRNEYPRFAASIVRARPMIDGINTRYMGYCYSAILRHAASLAEKPKWAPYLSPSPDLV